MAFAHLEKGVSEMIPGWQVEAYERLSAAVVRSVVNEYKKALRKSDRLGFVCDEQKKAEEWLLSKWGQFLSHDMGEYILERCQNTYKSSKSKARKNMLPDDVQKKMCNDYKSGMRISHISQKYKASITQVHTALRRWGT